MRPAASGGKSDPASGRGGGLVCPGVRGAGGPAAGGGHGGKSGAVRREGRKRAWEPPAELGPPRQGEPGGPARRGRVLVGEGLRGGRRDSRENVCFGRNRAPGPGGLACDRPRVRVCADEAQS